LSPGQPRLKLADALRRIVFTFKLTHYPNSDDNLTRFFISANKRLIRLSMSEDLPANVGLGGVEMNKKERSDWQKWWQFWADE